MSNNDKFDKMINDLGLESINEILFNWNESELSEDGSDILVYTNSRAYGPKTGGADVIEKKEFIDWVLSNKPFDTSIYGVDIKDDKHWVSLIKNARASLTML